VYHDLVGQSFLKQSKVAIQRYLRKQHAYAERARLYAKASQAS